MNLKKYLKRQNTEKNALPVGPSEAGLAIQCPASTEAQYITDNRLQNARAGTEAHEAAAAALRSYFCRPEGRRSWDPVPNIHHYSKEIQQYIHNIEQLKRYNLRSSLFIEKEININHPNIKQGRADVVLIGTDSRSGLPRIDLIDLKTGTGSDSLYTTQDDPQYILYLSGLAEEYPDARILYAWTYKPGGKAYYTKHDRESIRKTAGELFHKLDDAGDHCQFKKSDKCYKCRARAYCRVRNEMINEMVQLGLISVPEMLDLYAKRGQIRRQLDYIEAEVQDMIEKGEVPEGWEVQEGRQARTYDLEKAIQIFRAHGLDTEELYQDPKQIPMAKLIEVLESHGLDPDIMAPAFTVRKARPQLRRK